MSIHLYQPEWSGGKLVYRIGQDTKEFAELQMVRDSGGWWSASLKANRLEFAFEGDSGRIDLGGTQGCYPTDHFACDKDDDKAENFRNSSPEVWVKHGLVFTSKPGVTADDEELTVLTVNLHSYQEFATAGVVESELTDVLAQERVALHGPIFDEVANAINKLDPDLVCLQEVGEWPGSGTSASDAVDFGGTDSNMVHQILKRLDNKYHYTLDWSHYGFDVWLEGSAILSKHPLTKTGSRFISRPENSRHDFWKSRNIPMAQIDLPRLGSVTVFSVHAGWWDDEDEPFQEQFGRLVSWAGEIMKAGDSIIFCGDFNVPAGSKMQRFMTQDTGFSDQYALANPDGLLDATIGGDIDGWEGSGRGKRIDYVLLNDDSPLEVRQAQRIFTEKVFGRVSDHVGIYAHFGQRAPRVAPSM
jgi:endonuclease/exonuclease/phosphatase family metal-dependent hydrolase